jgi:iron(II)-dependent oxidoreductase
MQPVGAHPRGASPYGVLDMAGNAWEWTASLYRPYPYLAGDGREDAASPERRALRGGSFYHSDQLFDVRCAIRDGFAPADRYDHLGFRVASGA